MINPADPNEPLTEREKTWRIALQVGNIGVWEWDIVNNSIVWSDEVYAIHEIDHGTDIGQYNKYQEGIHADDRERVSAMVKRAVENGDAYEVEFRILTPTGREKWIQTKGRVIEEDGVPVRMIGATRDITRKKRAEIDLAKSEEKFRSISVSSPVGIFLTDLSGTVTYINPRVQEIAGVPDAETLMREWEQIIHPEDIGNISREWAKAVQEKSPLRQVIRVVHKDKSIVWALVRLAPMISDTGEYLGGTGTVENITGRILRDQQKDDFLAMASHELKTPVTSVKAYAQLLQRRFAKKGDMDSLDLVTRMDDQIDRLTILVSDLLDVSKIQSGKLQLNLSSFSIKDLVDEIVEQIQITCETHVIKIMSEQDLTVHADRDRVGQVLTNLLTNAIKYSPNAQEVLVTISEVRNQAKVSVQDFGVGIPKVKQDRLFERFYRVEGSYHETFPGLGLGLYISNEIMKRLKGSIGVKSDEGKGSIFYFQVPLDKEDQAK